MHRHTHTHKHIAMMLSALSISHSEFLCYVCAFFHFPFKCRHSMNLRIVFSFAALQTNRQRIHTHTHKYKQININSSQPHSNLIAEWYQNHDTIVYRPLKRALNSVCVFVCISLPLSLCVYIICHSANNQFIIQTVKLLRFENSKLEFYLPKIRVRNLLWASRSSQKQTRHFCGFHFSYERQRQIQREREKTGKKSKWASKQLSEKIEMDA